MQFNVELSELAERQYDIILSYISNVIKKSAGFKKMLWMTLMIQLGKLRKNG